MVLCYFVALQHGHNTEVPSTSTYKSWVSSQHSEVGGAPLFYELRLQRCSWTENMCLEYCLGHDSRPNSFRCDTTTDASKSTHKSYQVSSHSSLALRSSNMSSHRPNHLMAASDYGIRSCCTGKRSFAILRMQHTYGVLKPSDSTRSLNSMPLSLTHCLLWFFLAWSVCTLQFN